MNNDAHNDATNQPVSFANESTPDAAVFASTSPTPTSGTGAALGGVFIATGRRC